MREITRVFTVEATYIEQVTDAEYAAMVTKEEAGEGYVKALKTATEADDVNLVRVQDFVRDIDIPFEEGCDE